MKEIATVPLQIRLEDTDAAQVVYFARFFNMAHEALENFMKSKGFPLSEILENRDYLTPMRHAHADYLRPLRWGEGVHVRICVVEAALKSSMRTRYEFLNAENELCCVVHLRHVAILKSNWKRRDFPEEILKLLGVSAQEIEKA